MKSCCDENNPKYVGHYQKSSQCFKKTKFEKPEEIVSTLPAPSYISEVPASISENEIENI